METSALKKQFSSIGARIRIDPAGGRFSVNVINDKNGECFVIRQGDAQEIRVVNSSPKDRHLLIHAVTDAKMKFLCGHDERHWFAAAIPENFRNVTTVKTAMEALKPANVRQVQAVKQAKDAGRRNHRNKAYIRQGEWFFIPQPGFHPDAKLILRNEPIRRGGGKPHTCEFLYREGGEMVYVNRKYPNGITEAQYRLLPKEERKARVWRTMKRGMRVYAKGRITHSDHATAMLDQWCEVTPNTEEQARARRNLAFLD